jgi:ferredoxin--NADP+ reductase
VDVRIDPDAVLAAERLGEVDGLTRRKLEFLANLARKPEAQSARRITFRFCAAPVEIEERNGKVSGLKIERTELSVGEDGWVQARGTGEFETLPVGLVFRSVGYRGVPLEGVPFDDRKGIIPNADGRVLRNGEVLPRVYVSGWIKRGPSGVIGTNKADAAATVAKMVEDAARLDGADDPKKNRRAMDGLLAEAGVRVVTFQDWLELDSVEVGEGARLGKVRQKLTSLEAMLRVLDR